MPFNNDHIAALIIKHLQETITTDETLTLEQWIAASDDNKAKFDRFTNGEALSEELMAHGLSDQQIQDLVYGELPEVKDALTVTPKRNWMPWASVAAAVLVIAFAGIWLLRSKDTDTANVPQQQVPVATDIPPGGNKATLTLADGTTVLLDTFSNNQLVQQGGTNVYTKDGQLVYQLKGKQKEEVLYNTLTTSKGETFGMMLSDGSKVWLNSQSSIRYPVAFKNNIRKVEITGEAYIEVATAYSMLDSGKKRKQLFVVSLNGIEVEVWGTKFNVNGYSDEDAITTTLLEGKVKVFGTNNAQVILQPGQQAKLNKKTEQLKKVKDGDVDIAVAWHYGFFQFNDASLETVLRQLVRWYDVEVIYEGNMPVRKFWGKISRKNTLSQVLETLEKNNVSFKLEGKKLFVSP